MLYVYQSDYRLDYALPSSTSHARVCLSLQEKEEAAKEEEEEKEKGPMYVPRKGLFFQHDDRLEGGDAADGDPDDTQQVPSVHSWIYCSSTCSYT